MTNQSQGIQQLLAAEKKAADKVGEARKRKFRTFFSTNCSNAQSYDIRKSHDTIFYRKLVQGLCFFFFFVFK